MAITKNTDAYADTDDVTRLTGKAYSTTTRPTAAALETALKETADMLNAALSAVGYSVPVATSATRSSRILQSLNQKAGGAFAEGALPGIADLPPRAQAWQKEFQDGLKMIARGELSMPDVTLGDDNLTTRANQSPAGEFNLDASGDERDPVFDRDTEL